MFSTRLDTEVYQYIKSRPEGARIYIQRLVAEDIQRTGHQGGEGPRV